jgi:hypothetical protein
MTKFLQISPRRLSRASGDNIHIDIFFEMNKIITSLIKKVTIRYREYKI